MIVIIDEQHEAIKRLISKRNETGEALEDYVMSKMLDATSARARKLWGQEFDSLPKTIKLSPMETALAILEEGSEHPETGDVTITHLALIKLKTADKHLAESAEPTRVIPFYGMMNYVFSGEVVAEYKRLHDPETGIAHDD